MRIPAPARAFRSGSYGKPSTGAHALRPAGLSLGAASTSASGAAQSLKSRAPSAFVTTKSVSPRWSTW